MTEAPPMQVRGRSIGGMDLRSAWLILIACAAVSMVVASMAALNTALPDIAQDTGADSGQMTWIIDGYTLALAALLLPAGAIGDRLGRRGVLIAVVLAGVFWVLELRRAAPLLDVRLFTNRAFGADALSVMMQFFAIFGVFYLLLQQLQLVFGYSPLQSAFALMPMVAGVGIVMLGAVHHDNYWSLVWWLAVISIGIGLATAPSTTAIMSNTPLDNQGVGSAVNDTAREIGAAIGQMLTAQADAVADHVSRSLAEASAVADRLSTQAPQLARQLLTGAQDAFLTPASQAYIILGSILMASAVVLLWLAPRRVVAVSPELNQWPSTTDDLGDTAGLPADVPRAD